MAATPRTNRGGDLPFAKELFEAADRMRGSVESAEYKHLVLGLLFLKYISDSFERRALVKAIKTISPSTGPTTRSTEAAIRTKIRHLLRRYGYKPRAGGGGPQR